jgi:uncharacterized low-complexity protein
MIGAALAGSVLLSGSAFAVQALPQGYLVAAADTKAAEGKCGEGKCGSDASANASPSAAQKVAQAEGKCGEGKCGDASFDKHDTDRDGYVSRAEFLKAAPGGAAAFEGIDTNHDNLISEAEAYENLQRTYTANGKPMPKGLFAGIAD